MVDVTYRSGLDVAADGFTQLSVTLPGERLPKQNLAIARLLLLQNAQEDSASRRTQAREAVQQLLDFDRNSGIAQWIAARVELHPDVSNPLGATDEAREKGVALLQRATELEPDNAVFWYALYRGATKPRNQEPNALAKSALGKAYAAKPRNIFLLTEWLLTQAKTKDPAIADTLSAARQVLAPLAASVKRPGVDILQFIHQAIDAAKVGDWKTAEAKARVIQNVTRPEEIAKSDIARVDVHPLEYVLYDFSAEFCSANPRPQPAWAADTRVKLSAMERRLPALAAVEDMLVMDFDLNGLPDLLVLQPNKLIQLTQAKRGEPWSEVASLEVPAGMHRLLAADLDRDRRSSRSVASPGDDASAGAAEFDHVAAEAGACHDADPDIVVYGDTGVVIVRNDTEPEGNPPKFVAVPNEGLQKLICVTAGVLVDLDHDSDLDVIVSSQQGITIWQAGGKWEYKDISAWSRLPPGDVPVTTMVAVDWDRDGDIDVVAAEPTGKVVGLLENLRHAEFRWAPFDAAYRNLGTPSCVALVEADGNVSWDLLSAGERGVYLVLTATPRSGIVNYVRTEQVTQEARTGVLAWDFDNDGFRDAAAWGATGLAIFRGGPQGTFQAVNIVDGNLAGPVARPAARIWIATAIKICWSRPQTVWWPCSIKAGQVTTGSRCIPWGKKTT